MKKTMVLLLFMTGIMLLAPLGVIGKEIESAKETTTFTGDVTETVKTEKKLQFKVLIKDTEEIITMDCDEYIFGVVAAEMPALYSEEALKAQAVAAYTFAYSRSIANKDKDYDITTDFTIDQSFIKREDARKKWGNSADKYEEKIDNAVKSVSGEIMTYNNKPITAVYHAVSSGKTEKAEDIWGSKVSYLQSVDSNWDKDSDNYKSSEAFTISELKEKLAIKNFKGKNSEIIGKAEKTGCGTVKTIKLYGQSFSGADIRKILDLRSANFTVSLKDDKIVFSVIGYGHGVGMSQNGANCMAKEGKSYKEILTHYYKGVKIESLKTE